MGIANEVKRDLLDGKAPYIRNGNLYFDSVTYDFQKKEFYISHLGKVLVTWPVNIDGTADSVTLHLTEGRMKMKVT